MTENNKALIKYLAGFPTLRHFALVFPPEPQYCRSIPRKAPQDQNTKSTENSQSKCLKRKATKSKESIFELKEKTGEKNVTRGGEGKHRITQSFPYCSVARINKARLRSNM